MTLKFHHEDNGNCRVYYKDGAKLYCWQNDGFPKWAFYICSRDGEPSHEVTHGNMYDMPLPPGREKIGRELRTYIFSRRGDTTGLDLSRADQKLTRVPLGEVFDDIGDEAEEGRKWIFVGWRRTTKGHSMVFVRTRKAHDRGDLWQYDAALTATLIKKFPGLEKYRKQEN